MATKDGEDAFLDTLLSWGAMRILVLNSGSSSIKFRVIDTADDRSLTRGQVDRIGEPESELRVEGNRPKVVRAADHREGLGHVFELLASFPADPRSAGIEGIGHRVVHGGERFRAPTLIDADVRAEIHRLSALAPLHNPANLLGIEVAGELRPGLPQVAVFDTAFHQTLPPHAFHYALPRDLYARHGIRRYGFHGTSHGYVARRAAAFLGLHPDSTNLITLHLGNGASAAAIRDGRSVDTSMGLTPLEGLVMGTRSGDLDPAVVTQLLRSGAMSIEEVDSLLNDSSGLEGLCGVHDMREVLARAASGDLHATLALDVYAYRIRKYVGAYLAVLGRVDALVFTAGVGENAAIVRARCCAGLESMGIVLDPDRNLAPVGGERAIHVAESRIAVLVIPTDEELEISHQTRACIEATRRARMPEGTEG